MQASNSVLWILRRPLSTLPKTERLFKNAVIYRTSNLPTKATLANFGDRLPVVLLFTWLGAKERYGTKYVEAWHKRGLNVIHVTTSVGDLLRPRKGAEVTAMRIVNYLDLKSHPSFIHALSVGGYLTQRVLMAASKSSSSNSINKLTHVIYDSVASVRGFENGVRNGVSPKYRELAMQGVKLYKKWADLSSIYEAEDFMLTTPVPLPTLFIHSQSDKVALYEDVVPFILSQRRVSYCDTFIIPEAHKIPHVAIFRRLGEEIYMKKVEDFLGRKVDEDSSEEIQYAQLSMVN